MKSDNNKYITPRIRRLGKKLLHELLTRYDIWDLINMLKYIDDMFWEAGDVMKLLIKEREKLNDDEKLTFDEAMKKTHQIMSKMLGISTEEEDAK